MKTILTIAGTDYDGSASGWAGQGISNLELSWDLEADWSFSFSVYRICGGSPPYPVGVALTVDLTADDGSGRHHVFVGDLQHPQGQTASTGYVWNYTASGLKQRASYISLTALDGTGTASFNLTPDDPLALYATSGQTVGGILQALLCQPTNATLLSAAGIGAYTTLSPPTLPAVTLADLALLTVVPPQPVQLRGESILNTLEQLVLQNHEQYCLYILPDGTIRIRSIFGLTPVTVALPSNDGTGDNVDWPAIDGPDVSECYTAWQIAGLDIQSVTLSTANGTLWGKGAGPSGTPASGWTATQESAWTIADFLQPKNASDDGALSGVTSSSATVDSDYAAAHWVSGFWNDPKVGGWIWFDYLAGTGINIHETRQITSCTALTAGGTATVGWDSSLPLNSTNYTRYRIVGLSSPQSLVGRKFMVREPSTGNTGLNTYVGSHMYPRDSKGMPVANNSRVFTVFYPYAFVQWSRTGVYPWWEMPVPVQLDPLDGSIILAEPAVLKSAGLAGTLSLLQRKYPTNFADGLFYNVQVVIPYNRGAMTARWPTTGYSGTAYSQFGIQRTFVQHIDSFSWIGDVPSLVELAKQHLACVQDAVLAGSIHYYELPTNYDVFTPGFCLQVSASGSSTPLDGHDLPVRSARIRWHDSPDPMLYSAALRFSNKRRPFAGDARYIHPAMGRGTFGMQRDMVFGLTAMPGGMMGLDQYSKMMAQGMAQQAAIQAAAQAALGQAPMGETPVGQAPVGQAPMGVDVGTNQIAQAMADFGKIPEMGGMGPPTGRFVGPGAGSDGQKYTRDPSGGKRTPAEDRAAGKRAQRLKDQDKAINQRRAERREAQQRAASLGAGIRAEERRTQAAPLRAAMEARKAREREQREHQQQLKEFRTRPFVGPREPIDVRLKREAQERGQQASDVEFGPLGPSASGSGDAFGEFGGAGSVRESPEPPENP